MKKTVHKALRFIFGPVIVKEHVVEKEAAEKKASDDDNATQHQQAVAAPAKDATPKEYMPKDYTFVPRADAHAEFFKAMLDDDTGTMSMVHAAYPSATAWMSPIDPSSTSSSQPIPLIHYAALGNGDALRWFLERGVDVETVDKFWFKCTPLYLAAGRNNVTTVKILLAAGADPFTKSAFKDYYDIIEEAARFGGADCKETVALLHAARAQADVIKKPPLVARRTGQQKKEAPR